MDMSEFLQVFLEEMDEQLQTIEEQLLELETNQKNPEIVQIIFRAAHSLKGASAAMGYARVENLTHKMENIFDRIRRDTLHPCQDLISVMLTCVDMLQKAKEKIGHGQGDSIESSDLVAKLQVFEDQKIDDQVTEKANGHSLNLEDYLQDQDLCSRIHASIKDGDLFYQIQIQLKADTMMKPVRALIIENMVAEMGEVCCSNPHITDADPDDEEYHKLLIGLISKECIEDVRGRLDNASDVENLHIVEITQEQLEQISLSVRPTDNKIAVPEMDQSKAAKSQQSIRVDTDRLDSLVNHMGEIVIAKTRHSDALRRVAAKYSNDPDIISLQEIANHMGKSINFLQADILKTRMQRIEQLFNRFPRVVRDVAQKSGKNINFVTEGKDTEIDRLLIEEIGDPIIHLLRNAIDHGIESPEERIKAGKEEQGNVTLKATYQDHYVVISLIDDGKGIDPVRIMKIAIEKGVITEEDAAQMTDQELIFLIMKAGFSTAKEVSNLSGRGVGMDVVKSQIEKVGGILEIDTSLGKGSEFRIKLPLTLAIIKSLMVKICNQAFAIPLINVIETLRIDKREVNESQGVIDIRNQIIPLVKLPLLNHCNQEIDKQNRMLIVVIGIAQKRVALVIDETIGNTEVVVKSLGSYVRPSMFISSATIMGDGSVSYILDVANIINEYGSSLNKDQLNLTKKARDRKVSKYVAFKLQNETFALPAQVVRAILKKSQVGAIVNGSNTLEGMIPFRESIIPSYNFERLIFNNDTDHMNKQPKTLVIEEKGHIFALQVQDVDGVYSIDEERIIMDQTVNATNDNKFVYGLYNCKIMKQIINIVRLEPFFEKNTQGMQ